MDINLKNHLARKLRIFRKQAILTQDELAEKIGRTGESISNIERGRTLPAIGTLIALSEALAIPVRDFLPDSHVDDDKSPNRLRLEAEATAILRTLSDDRAKIALNQLKALADA